MPIRSASDTKFLYYPVFHRIIQHSADGGKSLVTRVVSASAGPFDFSTAAVPAAVTVTIKTDNTAVINETLDLSGVGSISAVTVAELATAWTAASVTGYTGTAESVTGFFKIAKTVPGTARYMQIGGELATITGMRSTIFKGDTQKKISIAPNIVDSEKLEIIDSLGKKTIVIAGAYRTGSTPVLEDTAMSKELRAAIEGGTLTTISGFSAKEYAAPGPETIQPIVSLEAFYAIFAKDSNQSSVPVGYLWNRWDSCKGKVGDLAGDRNGQTWTYTFDAVPYRDPVAGTTAATDEYSQELTTTEFAALDVFNV